LQSVDRVENGTEELWRDRHLRDLEEDLPGMAHRLGRDLDELLPQGRQRPVTRRSGRRRLAVFGAGGGMNEVFGRILGDV
jgi:hypothetical protein